MKRSLSLFAAALAVTLAAAAQSRADQLFWYNWGRNPFSIPFVEKNSPSTPGSGGVNLIDLNSQAVEADGTLATSNPAVNVQVISTAQSSNPDIIATGGGKYTLTLELWKNNPNPSDTAPDATVTFYGQLGNLMKGGQPIGNTALATNLSNTIFTSSAYTTAVAADPLLTGAPVTKVTANGVTYSIWYTGFSQPGTSGDSGFGGVSFYVAAAPSGSTDGGKSPEPSGVVLGCLGLTVLGGVAWRARRRKLIALRSMA